MGDGESEWGKESGHSSAPTLTIARMSYGTSAVLLKWENSMYVYTYFLSDAGSGFNCHTCHCCQKGKRVFFTSIWTSTPRVHRRVENASEPYFLRHVSDFKHICVVSTLCMPREAGKMLSTNKWGGPHARAPLVNFCSALIKRQLR